jgi:peptide/nickel transport system permease protein
LGTGFDKCILAISISTMPAYVRILRASIMSIRNMEYLEAAESINCSRFSMIVKHVLPNSLSSLIVTATMGVASSILMAAGLSYVGLGVQPPTPEWGAMLSESRNYIRDYPHMVIFPGLLIAITVLSFNMLGDGLRDALDPKLKR